MLLLKISPHIYFMYLALNIVQKQINPLNNNFEYLNWEIFYRVSYYQFSYKYADNLLILRFVNSFLHCHSNVIWFFERDVSCKIYRLIKTQNQKVVSNIKYRNMNMSLNFTSNFLKFTSNFCKFNIWYFCLFCSTFRKCLELFAQVAPQGGCWRRLEPRSSTKLIAKLKSRRSRIASKNRS